MNEFLRLSFRGYRFSSKSDTRAGKDLCKNVFYYLLRNSFNNLLPDLFTISEKNEWDKIHDKQGPEMKKFLPVWVILLFAGFLFSANSGRSVIPINQGWNFSGENIFGDSLKTTVNLPHTWNNRDAQAGFEYYRGPGRYSRTFFVPRDWADKRLFIRFEGAQTIASVFLNTVKIGEHRGGYSAFVFELTDHLKVGSQNYLEVVVDNSHQKDVLPLAGDFNLYGGLFRPAAFILTNKICVTPLDYASPGVYLKPLKVTAGEAQVQVLTKVSNGEARNQNISLRVLIFDRHEKRVTENEIRQTIPAGETRSVSQNVTIVSPRLWNGTQSAYLYRAQIQLFRSGRMIDQVVQPLGLRTFRVDPDEGFFLNGNHLKLHGVSRHQDVQDKGSAVSNTDHRQDVQLMQDMGVNAVRLAHYQHSDYFYSLCDSAGIAVWSEIPFVGSLVGGYNPDPAFEKNAKQQLTELIRQNYNHPSIVFWGLFNELSNPKGKMSPVSFVKKLQELTKREDPGRLTTAASFLRADDSLSFITDAIAWNKYFGWYYGQPQDVGKWADKVHKKYPHLSIGISEYGAGANIAQHQVDLRRPFPIFHPWHPEEWQAYCHEKYWAQIQKRPFIWGSFVWNMFDFSSVFRREGGFVGLNDKGLVTYDRKVRKDAFYFYKANWSSEPFVHLTQKRFKIRHHSPVDVKAYSNLQTVELIVNGKSLGKQNGENGTFVWRNVALQNKNNRIKVVSGSAPKVYTDACIWSFEQTKLINFAVGFFRWGIKPFAIFSVIMVPVLFILGYRKNYSGWKRRIFKILFYLFVVIVLLFIVSYFWAASYNLNIFDYSVI